MKMRPFIVLTENFKTRAIACKALKAVDSDEITHKLYIKASMKNGKIVITSVPEMEIWTNAIKNYKPVDRIEAKIVRVLRSNATLGLKKRTINPI